MSSLRIIVPLALSLGLAATRVSAAVDGALDPDFGDGGIAVLPFPGDRLVTAGYSDLERHANGGLLVAISPVISAAPDFGVVRLDADGSPDTSFGVDGAGVVAFDRSGSSNSDVVRGIALQPDGKIVLSGSADGADSDSDFAIVRLDSAGMPDSMFGSAGKVLVPFNLGADGHRADDGYRVDLQSDGKILVAGSAENDGGSVIAIARLLPGGQRDTAFDGDGRVTVDFGSGVAAALRVRELADGGLLAVGVASPAGNNDFAIVKLRADGSLDETFAGGGKITYAFDVGGALDDTATDFVELDDGRILVCGAVMANSPQNYDFGCLRLRSDGSLDPSFPRLLVPIDAGEPFFDAPLRMQRDAQRRFLLGGSCSGPLGNFDFCLVRLRPDGAPDPSFGSNGTRTYGSTTGAGDLENVAHGLIVQPDGKIVVSGYAVAASAPTRRIEVARILSDSLFADGFD